MAQNWDYAELSKAAKTAGGPEKQMAPWIGFAAIGASLLTAATIKVVDYFKYKKKNNAAEIKKAKEEIIKGIKEYDATHPDEEGGI